MKRLAAILLALLMLFALTACGGEDTLIGTWEGPLEISVLGVGVEEPTTANETIRFPFSEDGTGSTEIPSDLILAEMPYQPFRYTTDAEELTLTFDNGQTMVFTFHLDGNTLGLDGRAELNLTRTNGTHKKRTFHRKRPLFYPRSVPLSADSGRKSGLFFRWLCRQKTLLGTRVHDFVGRGSCRNPSLYGAQQSGSIKS